MINHRDGSFPIRRLAPPARRLSREAVARGAYDVTRRSCAVAALALGETGLPDVKARARSTNPHLSKTGQSDKCSRRQKPEMRHPTHAALARSARRFHIRLTAFFSRTLLQAMRQPAAGT